MSILGDLNYEPPKKEIMWGKVGVDFYGRPFLITPSPELREVMDDPFCPGIDSMTLRTKAVPGVYLGMFRIEEIDPAQGGSSGSKYKVFAVTLRETI